jgi:hypothetical protein
MKVLLLVCALVTVGQSDTPKQQGISCEQRRIPYAMGEGSLVWKPTPLLVNALWKPKEDKPFSEMRAQIELQEARYRRYQDPDGYFAIRAKSSYDSWY